MPHYPAPNCSRWSVTFQDNPFTSKCELTFAVYSSDGSVNTSPGGFAALVNAAVTSRFPGASSVGTQWTGCVFEDVSTLPYGGADFPMTAVPGTITSTGVAMPNSNCIAIRRQSSGLYRSGRGRVYWPVWSAAMLNGQNIIDDTVLANIVSALTNFQADLTNPTGYLATWGHLSTQTNKTPNNPMIFHQTLAWGAVDKIVDDQRRRLPGRGS